MPVNITYINKSSSMHFKVPVLLLMVSIIKQTRKGHVPNYTFSSHNTIKCNMIKMLPFGKQYNLLSSSSIINNIIHVDSRNN